MTSSGTGFLLARNPDTVRAPDVALPESARWVDMLVPFGPDPSDAWGPLRPDLTNRDVFLEVYSRSVPAKDLITCVLESVWGYERWHKQRRAERTRRPPLCLVTTDPGLLVVPIPAWPQSPWIGSKAHSTAPESALNALPRPPINRLAVARISKDPGFFPPRPRRLAETGQRLREPQPRATLSWP